jgi:transposase
MKRLQLASHLSPDELKARYRQAADPAARSPWHILWLLAQGQSTEEVARHTGYSKKWIYAVVRRYNAEGPDGVGDRRLQLASHLSPDELKARYRQATDPVARSPWHILWLLAQGQSTEEVARHIGYSKKWIYAVVRRYNAEGPDGVGDRRHANRGGTPLLSQAQQAELRAALAGPAPDGGLWSGPKVAGWMATKLGRKVPPPRGWEMLQRLRYRSYAPRPRHDRSDPQVQVQFKTALPTVLQTVQSAPPAASIELWSSDEHRVGLKPILRRIWCPQGQRPLVAVRPRYQWLYVYGFVCPTTGQTFWLLLPTVSIPAFNVALGEFSEAVGAGPDKQVLLVLDRAGWHMSPQVQVPTGLHLVFLPPYSPELQPAERLWSLTDEPLANRPWRDLDELMEVQAERCRTLQQMPDVVRARTHFHWWPKVT